MDSIIVSVIVPTHKPQDYLWECLDSLNNQVLDKRKFEVIIVLNGLKDPYEDDIKNYIKNNSELSIKYIYSKTPGVSNARNIGIDMAKGEYIAFMDDDDFVSDSYLKELLMSSHPECIGLSDCAYFNNDNKDLMLDNPQHRQFKNKREQNCLNMMSCRSYFNGPCMKMIHKDIIGNRKFDVRFNNGEDSLFMTLISDRIKHVKFTTGNAIYYRRIRQNSATTTRRPFKEIILNVLRIDREIVSFWFNNPFRYNFIFMISRLAAGWKGMLVELI